MNAGLFFSVNLSMFSYIMGTTCYIPWNDNNVWIALDQHVELDWYITSTLFSLLYNLICVASALSVQPRRKSKFRLARNQDDKFILSDLSTTSKISNIKVDCNGCFIFLYCGLLKFLKIALYFYNVLSWIGISLVHCNTIPRVH
jgi:hypothetical protein